MPAQETIVLSGNSFPAIYTTLNVTPVENINYLPYLLMAFYFLVSSFLFYRFIHNLKKLLSKIKGNKTVIYSGAKLVLTNSNSIPFSFMKYIFINKGKYEKGTVEKEVLQHELAHVKQLHSLDVMLVELFIVFAWFNPLLFLLRRSILLNHEYLADDSVVKTFNDTKSYQLLLFKKANQKSNLILSSSFNYLITKKRLIMMTRKTSHKVAIIKQIVIIPLIAALGFLFSAKVVAQSNSDQLRQKKIEASSVDSVISKIDMRKIKLDKVQSEKEAIRKNLESKLSSEQNAKLDQEQQSKLLSDKKVKLDKEQQVDLMKLKAEMELQQAKIGKDQKSNLDKKQAEMLKLKAEMELQKLKMGKDQRSNLDQQQPDLNKLKAEMLLQKALMSKELKLKLDDQQADMNKLNAEMDLQKTKMGKNQKIKLDKQQAELLKLKADMELQNAKLIQDQEAKTKVLKEKMAQEQK